MSTNKESDLRTSCEDCTTFVSCQEGVAADEILIAEIETTKLIRQMFIEQSNLDHNEFERARTLKEFEFQLWVMKNELYKDDPPAYWAAVSQIINEKIANIELLLPASGTTFLEQITDEDITLCEADVRARYRKVLLEAVSEKGCEGPQQVRGGLLGWKVMTLCRAPISDVQKVLARNPPFADKSE